MPMRQRIGLSLAMLMISTAALAGTPKKHGTQSPIQPPISKSRSARRAVHRRPLASLHASARHGRHWRRERVRSAEAALAGARAPADQPAVLGVTGRPQIGRAAWYGLEGRLTASGQRMDDSRDTAAHLSLPLLSYARVTNLDNGRSVVVEINDRGPYSRRFIIDLSPRAAQAIGMRGVAAVAVQPVEVAAKPGGERVAAVQ
ncbi:MAG: septal ring lytic transglycosylase RlpA family protein [Stellaceae bacterium]